MLPRLSIPPTPEPKTHNVKYCLMVDRPLYDAVRVLAQRMRYPMAAIFRDGAALILDRDKEAMAMVRADREATK